MVGNMLKLYNHVMYYNTICYILECYYIPVVPDQSVRFLLQENDFIISFSRKNLKKENELIRNKNKYQVNLKFDINIKPIYA